MMLSTIVVLTFVSTVFAGYLPPENGYYDNQTPPCSCDDDRMSDLTSRIERLEQKTHYREKRQEELTASGPVAFTAYLSKSHFNMNQGQAVTFEKTLLNEGGHYDVTSGHFTAPVAGIYMFSFIIESKHETDTAAQLVVDGQNMLDAVVEPRHHEQNLQGGNVGVMRLVPGQQVWIAVYNTGGQYLEGLDNYRFTTFTGVLLHQTTATTEVVG